MTITERLFQLMKEKKITQNQLAEILNTKQATISSWKRRGTTPPLEYALDICKCLDISIGYLLTGEEAEEEHYTKDEQQLTQIYRTTDQIGKQRIMEYASEMQELHPAPGPEEQETEPKSKDTERLSGLKIS